MMVIDITSSGACEPCGSTALLLGFVSYLQGSVSLFGASSQPQESHLHSLDLAVLREKESPRVILWGYLSPH